MHDLNILELVNSLHLNNYSECDECKQIITSISELKTQIKDKINKLLTKG